MLVVSVVYFDRVEPTNMQDLGTVRKAGQVADDQKPLAKTQQKTTKEVKAKTIKQHSLGKPTKSAAQSRRRLKRCFLGLSAPA